MLRFGDVAPYSAHKVLGTRGSVGIGVDVDRRFWATAGRNTAAAVLVNSGSPSLTSAVLVHIFGTPVQQKTQASTSGTFIGLHVSRELYIGCASHVNF